MELVTVIRLHKISAEKHKTKERTQHAHKFVVPEKRREYTLGI
jgi:hypothetical protein